MRRDPTAGAITRRTLLPRSLVLAAAVVLAALVWVSITVGNQIKPTSTPLSTAELNPSLQAELLVGEVTQGSATTGVRSVVPGQQEPVAAPPAATATAFAAIDDLPLTLPHPDVELVAFREGNTMDALPLTPVGRLVDNANPEEFTPPRTMAGPDYAVLPAEAGIRPATAAVDVLVPHGAEVGAPVAGEVVEVESYPLPNAQGLDWRVVLAPVQRPDLHVIVRNLEVPLVAPGDVVDAGDTLGIVRDRTAVSEELNPDARPHVRLAVRPAVMDGSSFDPRAPAVPAAD